MMTHKNVLDRISVMVDVISSSPILIGLVVLFVLISILFMTTNKQNAKKTKIIYSIIYLLCIGGIIFFYHSSLLDLFDYLMNHLFIFFYFPNLAAYFLGIIITNVILWRTVFKDTQEKALKIINSIIYCLLHYLFILILNVIVVNDLDVFSDISIHQNTEANSLIGLSSTIFVVWILFILIYSMIRKYQNRGNITNVIETIQYVAKPSIIEQITIPNIIQSNKRIKEKKLKKIEQVLPPLYIYSKGEVGYKSEPTIIEQIIVDTPYVQMEPLIKNIETTPSYQVIDTPEPLVKNIDTKKIEANTKEQVMDLFDGLFTLEDYKVLLNMLKTKNKLDVAVKEEKPDPLPIQNKKIEGLTELEAMYRM